MLSKSNKLNFIFFIVLSMYEFLLGQDSIYHDFDPYIKTLINDELVIQKKYEVDRKQLKSNGMNRHELFFQLRKWETLDIDTVRELISIKGIEIQELRALKEYKYEGLVNFEIWNFKTEKDAHKYYQIISKSKTGELDKPPQIMFLDGTKIYYFKTRLAYDLKLLIRIKDLILKKHFKR